MSDKNKEIQKIAHKLFLRHGYQKVKMIDIAEALHMSRPTLYKVFANKEAIFSAIALDHIETNKIASLKRLKAKKDTKAKIECLFDIWIIEPFASVIDSENGRDLLENGALYAPEAIAKIYTEFEHALHLTLKEGSKNHSKIQSKDLAHILVLATKGLKASTETLQELKRMIDGLILMALASLNSPHHQ